MAKLVKNQNLKYSLIAIGVAVFILLVLIVVKSPTTQNLNASDSLAPASILNDIRSISNSVLQSIGVGSATTKPKIIQGSAITQNNKPLIVYMGAEYCPYCATERWAMVVALSRFGTFNNLKVTHSSSSDVYPNTQTFSFHGSTYSSPYIAFQPVEMYSNIAQGSSYSVLDKPTSQQQSLMNTYDAPPYVPSADAGAIPFIYFSGKYIVTGASYSPLVLQGKTANEIASSLSNPKNPITQGVGGAANLITAATCGITNNQPSNICTSIIQSIEKSF